MADTPEPKPSDIDVLMIENPLDLTKENIDRIIAYTRKHIQMLEGGKGKAAAKAVDAEKPKIDVQKLLGAKIRASKPDAGPRRF